MPADSAPPPDSRGTHIDYRASLAAERTYLAQVRTGLALVAAGVASVGAFPDGGGRALRLVLGLGLILVGALLLAAARPRWKAVDAAMRAGAPLPPSRIVGSLAWLVLVAALVAAVVVLLL